MAENEKKCDKCPDGQVLREGRCVMPEVTFTTLIMSLNTSALYHLGELDNPETGEKNKDVVLCKHTIDTLQLLKDKTSGNLTEKEKVLLDNILTDLRFRYVKETG